MTLKWWPCPPPAERAVDITIVRPLGGFKLYIWFSGREYGEYGVHDFSALVAGDSKRARALRDPDYFARVRIGYWELVWPNGFRVGAVALHDRMKAAGELHRRRGKLRSFLDY
jgi:Protein of unknown function (DUF2442)